MSASAMVLAAVCGFALGCYCGYRLAPKTASPLGVLNPLGWL